MKGPGRQEENRRVKKKGKALSPFFKIHEEKTGRPTISPNKCVLDRSLAGVAGATSDIGVLC
jgi:hypothetical protein